MLILRSFVICFFLISLHSCSYIPDENEKTIDLKEIKRRGKLIVLTENSSLSYYEYRDKKLGFEYEILDSFAKKMNLPLEIKVVNESDKLVEFLKDGEGDVIAANLCVSLSNVQDINFTSSHYSSPQVLIQRKGKKINSVQELDKKTIYVRKNSSFLNRLEYLEDEIGIVPHPHRDLRVDVLGSEVPQIRSVLQRPFSGRDDERCRNSGSEHRGCAALPVLP